MNHKKRTKKEFVDYNEYLDRPFGLKWGTAFAMDELVQQINHGKNEDLREVMERPQMSREDIDTLLLYAFTKTKLISIQCNYRDEKGRLLEDVVGYFQGFYDTDNLYIENTTIAWCDIIHILVL